MAALIVSAVSSSSSSSGWALAACSWARDMTSSSVSASIVA